MVWMVAAASFLACIAIWHFRQGITLLEACGIFLASVTSFLVSHNYIIEKNTADQYIASGTVTSMVYRPSYTYKDDDKIKTEPEHWILEQASVPYDPSASTRVVRPYRGKRAGLHEECIGLCQIMYPEGEIHRRHWLIGSHQNKPVILHDVAKAFWEQNRPGDPAAGLIAFTNPLRANADVVYSGKVTPIPYFAERSTQETTRFDRLRAMGAGTADTLHADDVEKLNRTLNEATSISVGVIVTSDSLYFEKLRRAWQGGKPNDFVVVVQANTLDNRIANVNVLTWQNFGLVQHVVHALRQSPSVQMEDLLPRLQKALATGPVFRPLPVDNLTYLAIQLPDADLAFILSYQVVLCLYLLLLLSLDPSTKNQGANWMDIAETWNKHGRPSSMRYYLHPLSSTGVFFFYSLCPILIFGVWEAFFTPFRTLPGLY